MQSPEETVRLIQQGMAAYVKPREQVEHVRRVLAFHLESSLEGSYTGGPLSLIDPSTKLIPPEQRTTVLMDEFFKAVSANLKAQDEFDTVRKAHSHLNQSADPRGKRSHPEILDDKLHLINQQEKLGRLESLEKYINVLGQKPAADSSFLDLKSIFKDLAPLLRVPNEIVDSFATDEEGIQPDLAKLAGKLDKVLLKSKLLLTREEQFLQALKAKCSFDPNSITPSAKIRALDATRNELINWIESELSKASSDQDDPDAEPPPDGERKVGPEDETTKQKKAKITAKLETVKESYDQYINARKALITSLGAPDSVLAEPIVKPTVMSSQEEKSTATTALGPAAHLLLPYLANLSKLTSAQKSIIAYKSQFNISLAKQLKEACQVVEHLVPESQLLPQFPWPASEQAKHLKPGFLDSLGSATALEQPDLTGKIKPWVFASDSARIATMEAVAEGIEDGQMGIEGIVSTLAEISRMFGGGDGGSSGNKQADPWGSLALDLGLLGPKSRS